VGPEEEQAQDELREAVARTALLLRQEHHSQNHWEEVFPCFFLNINALLVLLYFIPKHLILVTIDP
jgi:hypothetical protein